MIKACIRIDANKEIASGHLMRCCCIAEALKKKNIDSVFVTCEQLAADMLKIRGFSYVLIKGKFNDLQQELPEFSDFIIKNNISLVIIDSYFVTEEYLSALSAIVKTVYIDDLNSFIYPVDTVINYTALFNADDYAAQYNKSKTKIYYGSKYTPLRSEFRAITHEIKKDVTDILITTGGGDSYGFSAELCTSAALSGELSRKNFHVICGELSTNSYTLQCLSKKNPSLHLYNNVNNMSLLMQKCDIAVSAGGTTLCELCACGTPTICICCADNQILNIQTFSSRGLMLYAGDIRYDMKEVINNTFEMISQLSCSHRQRRSMSSSMQKLYDGHGAERIAEIIADF